MSALVVGGAAAKEPAIAPRQFPRIRFPLIVEIDRLHVVVGVQEDGRLIGAVEPLAIGVRVRVADFEHLDFLQAGRPHLIARERRGAFDLLGVLAIGRDAVNRDLIGQAANDIFVVLRSAIHERRHGDSLRVVQSAVYRVAMGVGKGPRAFAVRRGSSWLVLRLPTAGSIRRVACRSLASCGMIWPRPARHVCDELIRFDSTD